MNGINSPNQFNAESAEDAEFSYNSPRTSRPPRLTGLARLRVKVRLAP
jgi:hypothetical protein